MKTNHRRGAAAFTLVELLVVIGIIAILVGILLPTIASARQSALNAACLSNLRQLHIGLNLYMHDNKGQLIPEWTAAPMWGYLLKPYLGRSPKTSVSQTQTREKVLMCPAVPFRTLPETSAFNSTAIGPNEPYYTNHSSFGVMVSSYGFNRWLYNTVNPKKVNSDGSNDRSVMKEYFMVVDKRLTWWKLQRKSPVRQIPEFFDCRWRDSAPKPSEQTYYPFEQNAQMSLVATSRHRRLINMAFVDGSARTLPLPELWAQQWNAQWAVPQKLPKVPW